MLLLSLSDMFYNMFKLVCLPMLILATVVYIYYMCLSTQYPHMQVLPLLKSHQHICKNVIQTATQGTWALKPHMPPAALEARRQLDMILRERKGWPQYLSHGDMRCGEKFPLPRPNYVKSTSSLIFDVQGQCDPQTEAPCCNKDTGWCGSGDTFCSCKNCIDYRKYIPAELADWKPNSGCLVTNFSQLGACSLMNKHLSYITFMGDSLVRHLFSSILLVLTNDFKYGALKSTASRTIRTLCQGDSQFIDSMCHVHIAMRWKDLSLHPTFCPQSHPAKFKVDFIEAYNVKHAPIAFKIIERQLSKKGSVVFLGIGIHNSFNATLVLESYLKPIVDLVNRSRGGWPRLVWLTTHSAGPLKPMYYRHQNNEAIIAYNKIMTSYCSRYNITVLDTFNMTQGVHSFDGTHYGFGVNMKKAQILLNYLREKFG